MEQQVLELSYALDTFYFLMAGALVMWMAAGFTMLEAGLVRSKNTTEILAKNMGLFAIACTMYMLVGYNIMYSGDAINSVIPGISFLVGGDNTVAAVVAGGDDAPYYSNMSDFFFQVVFVATAMSIISGAVAERMKLMAFFAFAIVFTSIIYPMQGFWTWGGGFLSELGFSDFAGSGIVHMAGASAALAAVILLGARKGKYSKDGKSRAILGSNMPLATLGVFILWLGWFGFNAGSQLKISSVEDANAVAMIFVNTLMAASAGVIGALITAKLKFGKADLTMMLNGALAGLVAITAEPLAPTAFEAVLIGLAGGVIVVFSILILDSKFKIDDPVGAISVHGVVGIFGLIAVTFTNPDATLLAQLTGIVVIFTWVFSVSFLLWFILKKVMGIRLSAEEEMDGADKSECGMEAYPEFTNR